MIENKYEEHIYKKDFVNQLIMIFCKHNSETHGVILISKNMLISNSCMFHILFPYIILGFNFFFFLNECLISCMFPVEFATFLFVRAFLLGHLKVLFG
jgi:hypothetical protein